jgi:hypothetical protein
MTAEKLYTGKVRLTKKPKSILYKITADYQFKTYPSTIEAVKKTLKHPVTASFISELA